MGRLTIYITYISNKLTKYLAVILPLFLITNYNFYPFDLVFSRVFVLCTINILIIVKFPLTKNKNSSLLKYVDYILIILTVLMAIYCYFELDKFIDYTGIGTPLYQMVISTLFAFLVYEATRRIAGPVLPTMSLILAGYAIYRGYSYSRIISEIFSYDGIFGIAFSLAISVVFMFLFFGNCLNQANFGNFLLKIGNTLVGGMSGGPAKVAVLSSSLFGTISGSAVANVVGTGTFTIPMMKKMGFEPAVAGAVEASASTGGLIMPPVMAAAAFIIAEILQVPYLEVAKAALLPALAYYVSVYTSVDLYSKKQGIKGVPKNERPSVKESMKEGGHLVLVLFMLIIFLIRRIDPLRAAFLTTVALLPLSYITKKTRLNFKRMSNALIGSSDGLLVVGSCCATVGSIIACIGITGLGGRIANLIVGMGGQNVLLVMFLVMITCLIFGLALPATASYLVLIAIIGPTLIGLGIVPMSAHLFVLYFAALSGITPPIALAAYAAAGIAHASLLKTAITAVKLSLVAFIIPFIFVSVPAMVLKGSHPSLLYMLFIYVLVLPISLAWGMWNRTFIKEISFLERIFYLATAVSIVYTSIINKYDYGIFILIIWIIGSILFHFYYIIPFIKKYFLLKKGEVR
jgi:TRAP transporter 4TM/12TM fusion protein